MAIAEAPTVQNDQKKEVTLRKHLTDMHALMNHIHDAMTHQAKQLDDTESVFVIRKICGKIEGQISGLESCRSRFGTPVTAPIKEAAASVVGAVAGIYNKVRDEGVARALRDDYTALKLAQVSYATLYVTARTLRDGQTAEFVESCYVECRHMADDVLALIPAAVQQELVEDGFEMNTSAVESGRQLVKTGELPN